MGKLLIKNIKTLYGAYEEVPPLLKGQEMKKVPALANAWLACEEGRVADFGLMEDFPGITNWKDLEVIDCSGKTVFPCFADSHTHIVFAANREQEFVDRLHGLSYEQIFLRGGGILNSALRLREYSEEQLFEEAVPRLKEIILQGTGSVEIKSGYGLDVESELKMLRVIKRLKELNWIPVKATFLGAHAVPPEFKNKREAYVDHIIAVMLPRVAEEGLADYIDVFCEKNYFTAEETASILEAGQKYGLKGKVHAEQMSHSGGIQAGINGRAVSVDHLEFCSDDDIQALLKSETIPTILPGAAFFLDLPRPPARKMLDAGLPLAFASDYNPGSCPTGNMSLMLSMACLQYKLTPEEAFNAVTINGAAAMELGDSVGSLSPGRLANFCVSSRAESPASFAYAYGSHLIEEVYLSGQKFKP